MRDRRPEPARGGLDLLADHLLQVLVDLHDGAQQRHVDAHAVGEAEEAAGVLGQADAAVGRAAADAVLRVDRALGRPGHGRRDRVEVQPDLLGDQPHLVPEADLRRVEDVVRALDELGLGRVGEGAQLAAERRQQGAQALDGLRVAAGDHGHPRVAEVFGGRDGPQELRVRREPEALARHHAGVSPPARSARGPRSCRAGRSSAPPQCAAPATPSAPCRPTVLPEVNARRSYS